MPPKRETSGRGGGRGRYQNPTRGGGGRSFGGHHHHTHHRLDRGDRGRGRRGRGGPSFPPVIGPVTTLANVLIAETTPNFSFCRYSVDALDRDGKTIASSGRRNQLVRTGLLKLIQQKTDKERESIMRKVFLAGTVFYTSSPFPGLETLPVTLVDGSDTDLDTATVQKFQCFKTPLELISKKQAPLLPPGVQSVSIDYRCSDCTMIFKDWNAVVVHCQSTGHSPVQQQGQTKPALIAEFLQYCNVALQRAMSERMPRWGRHYVNPRSVETPRDKHGEDMGVEVFQAYHVEFSVGRPSQGSIPKLMLTLDVVCKVIRTNSLLVSLYGGNVDYNTHRLSTKEQEQAKRKWIGETIISILDKSSYFMHDLVFEHSADSLMVGNLGMSHTQYYQDRKRHTLRYPKARPMIAVMGRKKQIIHFPAEIVCSNELSDSLKMQLPKIASIAPKQRHDAIQEIRRFLVPGAQKTRDKRDLLPSLGIVLSENLLSITAEVLPTPIIQAAGIQIDSSRGNWGPQLAKATFRVEPTQANYLNAIVIHHKDIKWREPYHQLSRMVNSYDSKWRLPAQPYKVIAAENDLEKHWGAVEINFASTEKLPDNVFVIDMTKPKSSVDKSYSVVKKMFASSGILSQFINFRNCNHSNPREERKSAIVLGGCARQVLHKTGVTIWWTAIPRGLALPAIFIGVDVFHAPRKYNKATRQRETRPSVAAIVVQVIHQGASNLAWYSQTFARVAGQEYDLGSPIEATLRNALQFLSLSHNAIGSCLVWRDGVGDTAIPSTVTEEVSSIRRILPTSAVAWIVCQKRISTKFLSVDRNAQPQGLLVHGLSDPMYPTFYLNGTSPPYSTPKPTRFVIAHSDGWKITDLVDLTWQHCHLYPNWSGPIKVPAVCQLSHLLAEYAGQFADAGESIHHAKFVNQLHFL